MKLYSERHGIRAPLEKTYSINRDMYSLLLDCCKRYQKNLTHIFTLNCHHDFTDSDYVAFDEKGFITRIKIRIPSLFRDEYDRVCAPAYDDGYDQYALLDLIEFFAQNIEDIAHSYQEAQDAIAFGKMVQKQDTLMAYADLGIFRLLCKFTERASLKEYIPESLIKILQHDKEKHSSLLKTLEIYLECNNNATKAANKLYIHYKTILYRLDRIQEISGVNLEDKEDRLQIEMGLKILHLLGEID